MFNSLRKQNKTLLNRTTMHFYIELRKTLRKKNIEKFRTFTFLLTILLWRLKVVFHCWKIHRSLVVISESWNDFSLKFWKFVCFFFMFLLTKQWRSRCSRSWISLMVCCWTPNAHPWPMTFFFLEPSAQNFCHIQHDITVHFFIFMSFSSLQLLLV